MGRVISHVQRAFMYTSVAVWLKPGRGRYRPPPYPEQNSVPRSSARALEEREVLGWCGPAQGAVLAGSAPLLGAEPWRSG